jgi:hypothetical protein
MTAIALIISLAAIPAYWRFSNQQTSSDGSGTAGSEDEGSAVLNPQPISTAEKLVRFTIVYALLLGLLAAASGLTYAVTVARSEHTKTVFLSSQLTPLSVCTVSRIPTIAVKWWGFRSPDHL